MTKKANASLHTHLKKHPDLLAEFEADLEAYNDRSRKRKREEVETQPKISDSFRSTKLSMMMMIMMMMMRSSTTTQRLARR